MAYHYGVDDFNKAVKECEDRKRAEKNMQFAREIDSFQSKPKKRRRSSGQKKQKSIIGTILNWFKS